jgi:hypothetical protein
MQVPSTVESHCAAGRLQKPTIMTIIMTLKATMMAQMDYRATVCHFFVVTPINRNRKVRTESFPKVVHMMDHAGAMTVYLITSDLSFALDISDVYAEAICRACSH